MAPTQRELILILDFGGQYSQLIARRIRECGVYCEIADYDLSLSEIISKNPQGIIFSGGPSSVYSANAPKCDAQILEINIPILGICYGIQLIAHLLGGEINRAESREYGQAKLRISEAGSLFDGIASSTDVWMSHGDYVEHPPAGFIVDARTDNTKVASMKNIDKRIFGVQFHPEVVHTAEGTKILKNFLFNICACQGNWNMGSFAASMVDAIRAQVGGKKVLCALSGGIDSAVAALLTHQAVGSQLTCVFVNHGFLRKNEPEQVVKTFRDKFSINLIYVDAVDRFMGKINGVAEPEQKRKIIGDEFIRVFEDEAAKLTDIEFLVQGTIYPDVIESGTKVAALIKSHHNVGGLPLNMKFKLVEPLRELFKDEVRVLAAEINLPSSIIWRQPFPGPGLAIRIIGAITKERLEILRSADAIVDEEIKAAGLYCKIWQSFAVLLAMKSVGVMGDERTYGYTVGLRAVTSDDAMTADWARLPYTVLESISRRIVNEVKGVNRVVYDITSKPPATIEWE